MLFQFDPVGILRAPLAFPGGIAAAADLHLQVVDLGHVGIHLLRVLEGDGAAFVGVLGPDRLAGSRLDVDPGEVLVGGDGIVGGPGGNFRAGIGPTVILSHHPDGACGLEAAIVCRDGDVGRSERDGGHLAPVHRGDGAVGRTPGNHLIIRIFRFEPRGQFQDGARLQGSGRLVQADAGHMDGGIERWQHRDPAVGGEPAIPGGDGDTDLARRYRRHETVAVHGRNLLVVRGPRHCLVGRVGGGDGRFQLDGFPFIDRGGDGTHGDALDEDLHLFDDVRLTRHARKCERDQCQKADILEIHELTGFV